MNRTAYALRDIRQDHHGSNQEPGRRPLVMARVLEQMTMEPFPVIGAEAARAQVDHGLGRYRAAAAPAARPASSVSMALICARIGIRVGAPGRTRARLAVSSRLTAPAPERSGR